ncbi:uncharacterized protein VTP21DRAFT_10871 [Calcarisporiella thermophila]|uniref:uncharacterized protein n=1 Tax=Calcarisporiella thermophila TaxID=911321 RepID=UPI0037439BFC
MRTTLLQLLALMGLAAASAIKRAPADPPGKTLAAISDTNFCLFLPPSPGGSIPGHIHDAVSFCTKETSQLQAPGHRTFPGGFIISAHFVAKRKYVQITGRLDRKKYNLKKHDQGGQFSVRAPPGSICKKYKKFVSFVEPNEGIYCLRCCNDGNCPIGMPTKGCRAVIKGDYS